MRNPTQRRSLRQRVRRAHLLAAAYRLARCALLVVAALPLAGCLNHYLIHPKPPWPGLVAWSERIERSGLGIRIEGARPPGEGPFPAVLVHPEAGHEAREMRGVLASLAREGYLAVAADYERPPQKGERNRLFAWRRPGDPTAALDYVAALPEADAGRIATLGFSQGGVYSLLIAANAPEVRAVVAYYPVTDFERWLDDPDRPALKRFAFRFVRRWFRRRSGAASDAELSLLLARASAMAEAELIRAPVLLIHGDRDTSAGVGESERLAERLRELGREVELVVVPDAGHVFNFKDREKAALAWEAALGWLRRHLGTASPAGEPPAG